MAKFAFGHSIMYLSMTHTKVGSELHKTNDCANNNNNNYCISDDNAFLPVTQMQNVIHFLQYKWSPFCWNEPTMPF